MGLFCRRESGYCQLCWYAASLSDVDVSGKQTATATGKQKIKVLLYIYKWFKIIFKY